MKKKLCTLLAALLALTLILSAVPALAAAVLCPECGQVAHPTGGTTGDGRPLYTCYSQGCPLFDDVFAVDAPSEPASASAKGYISVPSSGEGEGEIKFVSTRRCVVTLNGVKEYFNFRVEDGKLILTNAEGVETELTAGEDGKGLLEITLSNGETFTATFPSTKLSYIVNNGVFPIQTQNQVEPILEK